MANWLQDFFDTSGLAPHGSCLLWRPELYWTHAMSDALIAMAYFSIPAFLLVVMIRRPDLIPGWIMSLFAGFIVACGITHLMGLWTLWEPDYGPQAIAKVFTAAISLLTASVLWPNLPRILKVPSLALLESRNRDLERETAERIKAEQELRYLNQELERRVSERTAALHAAVIDAETANRSKTAFLAAMSHELRTPMNAILGFTEMLATPGLVRSEEKRRDYLTFVHESGQYLLGLISDLLDIARVESGKLDLKTVPMALSEALKGTIHRAREAATQAGLTFESKLSSDDATILADPKRVAQIAENLLSNAIKYNRPQGSVTIRADHSRPGWVGLVVADTGIGIPADKLNRLFIPFDRLDQDVAGPAGTGLGLVLSHNLCLAMGGELQIETREGEGSAFTAWFRDSPAAEG